MQQLMNEMDLDNLVLPKETLYLIDKVVRQRMSKGGPFGIQNSAVINLQMDQMRKATEENVSRLSCGRPIGLDQEGNPIYIGGGGDGNKQNQNEQLYEKLGQACNQEGGVQRYKKLTYDEWKRRKQAEQRIRAKLIEDALNDLKESLVRKEAAKKLSAQSNQMFIKQWQEQKKDYLYEKKQQELLNEQRKKRQKQMKKAMSNRTYKNWQAEKFKILKQQKHRKAEQQRLQIQFEEQKKRDQLTKRLAAEMSFKLWNKKLKKREKQQRYLKKLREKQAEMMIQQQKQNKKHGGVLLAYSLNKLIKKQPPGPPPLIRPSTASKIKKPRYFYEQVQLVTQQIAYRTPIRSGTHENIRIEDKLIPGVVDDDKRPRVIGKKKGAGSNNTNKKNVGGKGKKAKYNTTTNERPPPVGFEQLSSIHPGHHDQHSLEEPGTGFRNHRQND